MNEYLITCVEKGTLGDGGNHDQYATHATTIEEAEDKLFEYLGEENYNSYKIIEVLPTHSIENIKGIAFF